MKPSRGVTVSSPRHRGKARKDRPGLSRSRKRGVDSVYPAFLFEGRHGEKEPEKGRGLLILLAIVGDEEDR